MSTVAERRDRNKRVGESTQEAFERARRDGLCRFCLDPSAGPDPVDPQRYLCAACMPGGGAPATAVAPVESAPVVASAIAPVKRKRRKRDRAVARPRPRPALDPELLEAARSSGALLSAAHVGDREAIELSLLREAARVAAGILADNERAPLGPPPLSMGELANRFHDFRTRLGGRRRGCWLNCFGITRLRNRRVWIGSRIRARIWPIWGPGRSFSGRCPRRGNGATRRRSC